MFGKFIKDMRFKANLTLREFCRQLGEDANNWSKIEREMLSPPRDEEKLKKIAVLLNINENSANWNTLFDLASALNKNILDHTTTDKEIIKTLPIFLKTAENTKPDSDQLKELVQTIKQKENHEQDKK